MDGSQFHRNGVQPKQRKMHLRLKKKTSWCSCNSNNQNSSGIPKSETNFLEATSSLKKLFQWHKHLQSPKKNTAGHSSSTPGTPITTAVRILNFMKCPSKVMQAWSPSSTPDPDKNASSCAPGNIKQFTYQSKKKSKFKWFKSTKYSCFRYGQPLHCSRHSKHLISSQFLHFKHTFECWMIIRHEAQKDLFEKCSTNSKGTCPNEKAAPRI